MGAFFVGHEGQAYEHGARGRWSALGYVVAVVLVALPFLVEVGSGADTDGSFTFVFVMLATAPLGLAVTMMLGSVSELLGPTPVFAVAAVVLYAAAVLVQAWVVWRLTRGPVIGQVPAGGGQVP